MNVREQKIELRRALEAKRGAITGPEREAKERAINAATLAVCQEHLLDGTGTPTGQALFTYMPIRTEVDVTPVMDWCLTRGVPVVLSRTDRERKTMSLYSVTSLADLAAETGPWGIREPKATQPELADLGQIGLILVPGLGFDREFGRLGYGGGFYDRFMQRFEPLGLVRPYCLAAAFQVQVVERVPLGWHDFRVDEIVTESIRLKRKEGNG
ncbi:5-formyltetrahydrofolate cyclo-ligase [Paenibacillus chartarius]|uniref:5-formyltetrahydrofolate cyclo-ligase n=1 Tax=Paenibacillus chartarius TaxID=747481 RepID=A0ABV6DKS5_9BACL